MGPLLSRIAVIAFGAIQALLTLRLVLPYVDLPPSLVEFVPAIRNLSTLFVEPFRQFTGLLGVTLTSPALPGFGGPIGGGFTDRLDAAVIVALVGWSLIELVVLFFLRIFTSTKAS